MVNAEVVHGVAACEVAGFLTGGFILLYCGPLGAAAALAALEVTALTVGQLALLVLPKRLHAAAPSHLLPVVQPPDGSSALHHIPLAQPQSRASHAADPVADAVVVVKAVSQSVSSQTQYPAVHVGNGVLQGGPPQQPAPEEQTTADSAMQTRSMGALTRLSLWADQPASPCATAAVMIDASLVDLGVPFSLRTCHFPFEHVNLVCPM